MQFVLTVTYFGQEASLVQALENPINGNFGHSTAFGDIFHSRDYNVVPVSVVQQPKKDIYAPGVGYLQVFFDCWNAHNGWSLLYFTVCLQIL
jgi:hypothetical protein